MPSHTQTHHKLQVRPWPLVIGGFLSLVTARVLFDDVWHGAEITTSHILSLAAIVVALSAGHYAIPQLKARAIVSGAMLGLLFLGATAYVVISSGARNAEQASTKAIAAADLNDQRDRELYKLSEAEKMLAGARADLASECRSGAGKRCKGINTTIAVYEAAIKGHKTTLAELGPERDANGVYAHMAKTLAAVTGGNEVDIMARLILVMPFLAVLLSELGTITFLHMAIVRTTIPAKPSSVSAVSALDYTTVSSITDPELEELRRVLQGARRPLTNDQVAQLMGVQKSEASKRVAKGVSVGLINKHRVGREVAISLH